MRRWTSVVVLLCLLSSGCSVVFGRRMKTRAVDGRPVCTEGNGLWIADWVGAGALVGVGVIRYATTERTRDSDTDPGINALLFGAVVAVAPIVSGIIGYRRSRDCRDAIEDWQQLRGAK